MERRRSGAQSPLAVPAGLAVPGYKLGKDQDGVMAGWWERLCVRG